jgi:hypothetical protein
MEEVDKLFSTAFGQICALKEVDESAEMLNGAETTFSAPKNGTETCWTETFE